MKPHWPPLLSAPKHGICWLLLLAAIQFCGNAAAATPDRPNILFLFADDQRADTIHALGNSTIQTPNLDRLVERGLSFQRAYMQGGHHGATCMPSRAMLLSGRHLYHVDETLLRDDTWPAAFARAGYTTFLAGKWHNGTNSVPRVFQDARAVFAGGMVNPLKASLSDLEGDHLGPAKPAGKHACAAFADAAINFLHRQDPNGAPFLCYLAFDAPHDPHIVPEDYPVRYDPATIPLPKNFLPQHPWDNGEMTVRDELLLPWPRQAGEVRELISDYYRYISYLDSQIGRVLDALDASPFARNTIVVFAADSGVARGSHGLIGKQNLYEHSIRVPLLIAGPGIAKHRRTDAMCYLFDVLPTLGARARVPGPATSDGVDLNAVLTNPDRPGRTSLFFGYRNLQRAVRDGRWKLIRYPWVDRTQLFDLKSDPFEMHNLADDPRYRTTRNRLMTLLRDEQQRFADSVPLSVPNPKPAAWTAPAAGK